MVKFFERAAKQEDLALTSLDEKTSLKKFILIFWHYGN
jgi:hypothetical protein